MSSQRRFEGTNLEALLDEVRTALGDDVRIVAANRVRKGGVGGFFAREYFEVIAEQPEEPIDLRPPVRLGRRRLDATSAEHGGSRSVPRSVLDLVEERNAEERYVRSIDLGGIDAVEDLDFDRADGGFAGVDRFDRFERVDAGPVVEATWSNSRDVPVEALPVVDTAPAFDAHAAGRAHAAPQLPERYVAEPQAAAPDAAVPTVSTETERFAQILERLAHSTEHQPTVFVASAPAAPSAPPAPAPAPAPAPGVVSLVDAERGIVAPRPATASAPATPAPAPSPVRSAGSFSIADAAPRAVEETIERPEQLLVRLGLPARFVPRGMSGSALHDALVESLGRLPRAGALPRTKGVVIAIVGIGARPVLLGRAVSEELGLDPDEVVVATQSEIDGVPAWLQITEPDAADERRRSWRRRDQVTFVAVSQPSINAAVGWADDMLDRLEPTQLWGLASAGWKPEDVDAWSRRLGGFDLLALDRLVDTVSPASMLSLGIPVGRLDGVDATPEHWAEVLLERIGNREPSALAGVGAARS